MRELAIQATFSQVRLRRTKLHSLLAGVVALGLLDLALTLFHAKTYGMAEANPLGAWAMREGGSAGLAALKLTSLAICCLTLEFAWNKRRKFAESIAAFLLMIMLALSVHWVVYSQFLKHQIAIYNLASSPLLLRENMPDKID